MFEPHPFPIGPRSVSDLCQGRGLWRSKQSLRLRRLRRGFDSYRRSPLGVAVDLRVQNRKVGYELGNPPIRHGRVVGKEAVLQTLRQRVYIR